MSRIYEKQKRLRNVSILLVIGFTVVLWLALSQSVSFKPWHWIACYFASVNLVTWLLFFYDKRIAGRQGVVRVPENTLFLLSVAGGLPSTLLAMQILRHKRAKASFKWKLFAWFVVIYSIIGVIYWYFGDQLRTIVS